MVATRSVFVFDSAWCLTCEAGLSSAASPQTADAAAASGYSVTGEARLSDRKRHGRKNRPAVSDAVVTFFPAASRILHKLLTCEETMQTFFPAGLAHTRKVSISSAVSL